MNFMQTISETDSALLFAPFAVAAGYAQTVEKQHPFVYAVTGRHAAAGLLRGASRPIAGPNPAFRCLPRRRFRGRSARQCEFPFVFPEYYARKGYGRRSITAWHEEGHAGRNVSEDLPRNVDHDPCDGDWRLFTTLRPCLRPCGRVGRGQNPDRGERFGAPGLTWC